jgi:hypothetical protein
MAMVGIHGNHGIDYRCEDRKKNLASEEATLVSLDFFFRKTLTIACRKTNSSARIFI